MTKEVAKWADDAMFKAEEIQASKGPQVQLLSCNPDPLGSIAAAAKAYKGEFVGSLAEITDEERRYYLAEIRKTALAMPMESVNFQFHISGVTRGFTHQMVRQRTAAYSQESTRFAVKETVPVGLPPSLIGTVSEEDWHTDEMSGPEWGAFTLSIGSLAWEEYVERHASDQQKWRFKWDSAVGHVENTYNSLVNSGMPAEDARGLLPTNLLTQINYHTSLRGLVDHAGLRLCTQAQFEWREVWMQILSAIRDYGKNRVYHVGEPKLGESVHGNIRSSEWQFEELSKVFRPICYYKGSCQFNADFDRKCSIKGRVEDNAAINRPSTEWGLPLIVNGEKVIDPIFPEEWMFDPSAAR